MASNEIIAEYEELDQIVKNFADGIGTFLDKMNTNSHDISNAMGTLFSAWTGSAAESFKSNMEKHIAVIQNSTERASVLQERLKAVSVKMAQALSALREGGTIR